MLESMPPWKYREYQLLHLCTHCVVSLAITDDNELTINDLLANTLGLNINVLKAATCTLVNDVDRLLARVECVDLNLEISVLKFLSNNSTCNHEPEWI